MPFRCHHWLTKILAALMILMFAGRICLAQNVPSWTLVWSDEFNGSNGSAPSSANWNFDQGGNGWGNSELETYTTRRTNSWVENGTLIIQANEETYTGTDGFTRDYTSARLITLNKRSWKYGRIEARMKIPKGQGIWPAFWMMGADLPTVGWPACGEMDVMENVGKEPRTVHVTVHGPGYSGSTSIGGSYSIGSGALGDDFHLYTVEWETNHVQWSYDNKVFYTLTPAQLPAGKAWVFDKPFFILLNLAVGGSWPGSPDATTVFPQRLVVDYLRVYTRSTTPSASLQIVKSGDVTKAIWPGEFPHANLQRSLGIGQSWQNLPILGVRETNRFTQTVSNGIYRLSWP